ncbi:MAG: DUF1080 domain-containing protein, partial [Verrucomicrobia bacterium]|nr:DUF1080 domain-containing protein [Verrucomicrobiota bacterium]NDF00479.1 DUF1080 domain-containing protein [Verrucomicrobiota bacterium]
MRFPCSMKRTFATLLCAFTCATLTAVDAPVIKLLNGKDLDAFTVFMKDSGNTDPDKVFTVRDGMLYISGQRNGYLATKREFANYRLVAEFKWAEKNWPPRDQK